MARHRGKRWQADVRGADGERHRPTFATQKEAETWEEEARKAVELDKPLPDAKSGLGRTKALGSLRTIGGLYDHVKRTEWDASKSALTASRNGLSVVNHFGRNRDPDTITSAEIAEMKVCFAEQGLAPSTVNRKVSALSKMLRAGADAGTVDKVPRIRWNKEAQTKFRYLDETEEAVMLAYWRATGQTDLHDLTVLLVDTGARCFSEMLPVKWDEFGPNFSSVTFWTTKTDKPRTVPLTKRVRAILKSRRDASPHWPGPFTGVSKGGRDETGTTQNNMRTRWDTMREITGLHDVTPHTLRHTCCTRLVLGGADVKRVMTWMGHAAIVTTLRYMQIRPSALEDMIDILEPKGRPHHI